MASTTIKLATSNDWKGWIALIRIRAQNKDIWHLINPDVSVKPIGKIMPIEPDEQQFERETTSEARRDAYEIYKQRLEVYKAKLASYEKQVKAFADIITFIQETVTSANLVYIYNCESHPWNILTTLKANLAPGDKARKLAVMNEYFKLRKGPTNSQNMLIWINDWTRNHADAVEVQLEESNGDRPIEDFLFAIRDKAPYFSQTYLHMLELKTIPDMQTIIERFRQDWLL